MDSIDKDHDDACDVAGIHGHLEYDPDSPYVFEQRGADGEVEAVYFLPPVAPDGAADIEPLGEGWEPVGYVSEEPLALVNRVGDPTPQTDLLADGSRRFDPATLRATIAAAFRRAGDAEVTE